MKNLAESEALSRNLKNDIIYKINSMNSLVSVQEQTHARHSIENLQLGKAINKDNEILNQALNDALLNAMASLIDYYCVYCMVNLGIEGNKVRKVQYRALTKQFLLESSTLSINNKKESSLKLLRENFNEEISGACNLKIEDININDYWICFLGDAISRTLNDYGILHNKTFKLAFDETRNAFNLPEEIKIYHHCMRFLYINPANPNGARYGIYIDLNNFLKHNAVPYFTQRKEHYDNPAEDRLYSFFSIENGRSIFLKDGVLKDITRTAFQEIKDILHLKLSQGNDRISTLEEQWEIGPIIKVDRTNGFWNSNGDTLYFYVDNVLIAKTRDATLVDSRTSFRNVISNLIQEIESKVQYFDEVIALEK